MLIFKTTKSARGHLSELRYEGKRIGFAPTMGALHEGHLSLLRKTLEDNDVCATSIFINPTQFNDKKDLECYPRTLESDLEKLIIMGCHVLFYPDAKEIYPTGMEMPIRTDFGYLLQTMEAVYRKGHFEGVAQVVRRLLDIIQPHALYMGQKDYQQFLIVKKMIDSLKLKVHLVMCPTVREPDGLAMSSRNVLLNSEERKAAAEIPQTLFTAKGKILKTPFSNLQKQSIDALNSNPFLRTEYFEIVDAETLKPLKENSGKNKIAICTAVKVGNVRLIDNILIA